VTPNPSLTLTRYGSRRLAARGACGSFSFRGQAPSPSAGSLARTLGLTTRHISEIAGLVQANASSLWPLFAFTALFAFRMPSAAPAVLR
jgi:hypothetical protein